MNTETLTKTQFSIWPWFLAARPKTLTASLLPIIVGTALSPTIRWSIFLFTLFTAFMIQIGTNLFNDALDFEKGADTKQRLGPARATQMGWLTSKQVMAAGCACFSFAGVMALPLLIVGGMPFYWILGASLLFGYLYTGGPYPLAYVGLGDLFVLVFFGWIATAGTYALQTDHWSLWSFIAGSEIGLFSVALLAINNLRDHYEDAISSKKTLAVRFGKNFAKYEIAFALLAPFVLNLAWLAHSSFLTTLLPFLTLPFAFYLLRKIWITPPGKKYNTFLALTSLLQLLFGLMLATGFRLG